MREPKGKETRTGKVVKIELNLIEINLIRKLLLKRTRCATCAHDKTPGVCDPFNDGHWTHLLEDGSFLGPCFDPQTAPGFVAVASLLGRIEQQQDRKEE